MEGFRERVSRHYRDQAGDRYWQTKQADRNLLRYKIDAAFFQPYLASEDRVLDFGCGNGGLALALQNRVRVCEGLEVNPAARECAKSITRVYGSLSELRSVEPYDAIVTNHVLEHVRDVCGTLTSLRAVLREGGLLIAKVPIDDWRRPHHRRWDRRDPDWHLHTWTPRLFANTFHEAGFRVRECRIITWETSRRLYPLIRIGLGGIVCPLFAVITRRRQLLAVAERPGNVSGRSA